MYLGGNRFIHAPRSGQRVQVSSLSESWFRSRWSGARRLVAAPPESSAVRAKALRKRAERPLLTAARKLLGGA
jgi:hypothetical protein